MVQHQLTFSEELEDKAFFSAPAWTISKPNLSQATEESSANFCREFWSWSKKCTFL